MHKIPGRNNSARASCRACAARFLLWCLQFSEDADAQELFQKESGRLSKNPKTFDEMQGEPLPKLHLTPKKDPRGPGGELVGADARDDVQRNILAALDDEEIVDHLADVAYQDHDDFQIFPEDDWPMDDGGGDDGTVFGWSVPGGLVGPPPAGEDPGEGLKRPLGVSGGFGSAGVSAAEGFESPSAKRARRESSSEGAAGAGSSVGAAASSSAGVAGGSS